MWALMWYLTLTESDWLWTKYLSQTDRLLHYTWAAQSWDTLFPQCAWTVLPLNENEKTTPNWSPEREDPTTTFPGYCETLGHA